MEVFKVCASIALGLWIGGLSLFLLVVAPVAFRRLGKEEAGRLLAPLFPAVDRWGLTWGAVACLGVYLTFLHRHWAARSLVLELPVLAVYLLTLHVGLILHPQIHELKRRMAQPEFHGTARLEKLRYSFEQMHRRSVQIHWVILFLGWAVLGLLPSFLP